MHPINNPNSKEKPQADTFTSYRLALANIQARNEPSINQTHPLKQGMQVGHFQTYRLVMLTQRRLFKQIQL